jgi:hypothetical protein
MGRIDLPNLDSYFERCLAEALFISISDAQRTIATGRAGTVHPIALLFPIYWPEPFGAWWKRWLAAHQSIAFRCGSVPEVIEDGVTGFVVD